MERWQPAHYLEHLNEVPALPAKCGVPPAEASEQKPDTASDPRKLLTHLTTILQLPAPPELKLLAASSACVTFEDWLATASGTATRGLLRWRSSDKYHWSPINDGDDIEQRGLIYLWKKWDEDQVWLRNYSSRFISKVAFDRGRNDRYSYRRQRGNLVNEGLPLLENDRGDEEEGPNIDPRVIPDTHLHLKDQRLIGADRRLDVQRAIEATIKELHEAESIRPSNGHAVPVEMIVRTICHAFMHYSGQTMSNGKHPRRTSSDGSMRAYWEQHITERQWYRWKPRVLSTMAKHLEGYTAI